MNSTHTTYMEAAMAADPRREEDYPHALDPAMVQRALGSLSGADIMPTADFMQAALPSQAPQPGTAATV